MTREEMQDLVLVGIQSAVENVCSMMLGCEAVVGQSSQIGHPLQESNGVVALVGVAGPWVGTGAVTCNPELACRLASAFLLTECPEVNDAVLDAVAELTNMIIGNLKCVIEERIGIEMGLSTPTVIYGASFTTKIAGTSAWTLIPFRVLDGDLLVQTCIIPNEEGRSFPRFDVVGQAIGRI